MPVTGELNKDAEIVKIATNGGDGKDDADGNEQPRQVPMSA